MTLTAALAIVAGLVLALVVAHGAWNARRANPRQAHPNLPIERSEPTLIHPASDARTVTVPQEAPDAAAARRGPRIDALIDAIVPLRLESPISGEFVLSHAPPSRRAGSKPFLLEGLNAESGEWEPVSAGQRYGELQAGVLLANRTGALNEIEYSEFVQKAQAFAEAIGAFAQFPDMLEAVAAARELDAFASQHDAQLAVHLRARAAAWSVGYIQQHAGRHGFVPGVVPGRLVMPAAGDGAPPVLTLTFDSQAALADDPNIAAVRDVTLGFDVPQTEPKAAPFAAWQASAHALALDMDATIVDDNGRPLAPEGFAAINDELGRLYAALEGRDLAAGSAAARRLFS